MPSVTFATSEFTKKKKDYKDGKIDSSPQKELLKYIWDSLWPGLACSFVDLRCSAVTLLENKINLHASRLKFLTVWPPNLGQQPKLSDVHLLL